VKWKEQPNFFGENIFRDDLFYNERLHNKETELTMQQQAKRLFQKSVIKT